MGGLAKRAAAVGEKAGRYARETLPLLLEARVLFPRPLMSTYVFLCRPKFPLPPLYRAKTFREIQESYVTTVCGNARTHMYKCAFLAVSSVVVSSCNWMRKVSPLEYI